MTGTQQLAHLQLAAQIGSTCATALVATQHALQMAGFARDHQRRRRRPMASSSCSASSSISLPLSHLPTTIQSPGMVSFGVTPRHEPMRTTGMAPMSMGIPMATGPTSATAAAATTTTTTALAVPTPPSTRILRALCGYELVVSVTGLVTTSAQLHGHAWQHSVPLTLLAHGPLRCSQLAALAWVLALALYLTSGRRGQFDVAVPHAIVTASALFFLALQLFAVRLADDGYHTAVDVLWVSVSLVTLLAVTACCLIVLQRWRRQRQWQFAARIGGVARSGAVVAATLTSYTLSLLVFVAPHVVHTMLNGQARSDAQLADDITWSSLLLALWPSANAVIFLTKPMLRLSFFQAQRKPGSGGGDGDDGSAGMVHSSDNGEPSAMLQSEPSRYNAAGRSRAPTASAPHTGEQSQSQSQPLSQSQSQSQAQAQSQSSQSHSLARPLTQSQHQFAIPWPFHAMSSAPSTPASTPRTTPTPTPRNSRRGTATATSPQASSTAMPMVMAMAAASRPPAPLGAMQNQLHGLEIGEQIGRGIAVVYRGTWRGSDVAIKMRTLLVETDALDMSEDDEFQQACNREIADEAAVMKTLCHPNIVLFMEAGFYKRSICIVSEFCARGSLRDVLLRAHQDESNSENNNMNGDKGSAKPLSWSTKLRLALGIAEGIQYLHHAQPPMIHRDLKSPNVLVDDSWHAKIADFGTLRMSEIVSSATRQAIAASTTVRADDPDIVGANRNSERCSTRESSAMVMTGLVGTTRWMAPEVIRGEKYYSSKVDIYSLGLILWELIEGKLPFESTRWNHEIEDFVLQGLRPVLRSELCPLQWKLLVVTCWQTDPMQRPTIEQVISTLQRIAREETLDTMAPRFTGMSSIYDSSMASSASMSMSMSMSMEDSSHSMMDSSMFGLGASSSLSSSSSSFTSSRKASSMRSRQPFKPGRLDSSYVSVAESALEIEELMSVSTNNGDELARTGGSVGDFRVDRSNRQGSVDSQMIMLSQASLLPASAWNRRHQRINNTSFVSVAESELEDEDAAVSSVFYVETNSFLEAPVEQSADPQVDEVSIAPPPLTRSESSDSNNLISI